MTTTDSYQLKWHSHNSHMHGCVAALLRSERFTDVVLCTMDGSQIPAHKFILSSCSIYLSNLFEGQRNVTRMGGMLYIVLPPDITSRALKILIEYMYRGETTVSNEVLDTVLKAGEVLKIRGLWRQADEQTNETVPFERQTALNFLNKHQVTLKKTNEEIQQIPKIDDKIIKLSQIQHQSGARPMFIGPPKLVFIKTGEPGTPGLRPIAPKGQTIIVTPDLNKPSTSANKNLECVSLIEKDVQEKPPSPRILRRQVPERNYGKKAKTRKSVDTDDNAREAEDNRSDDGSKKSEKSNDGKITIKEEPDWDASSIEEEERSIAELFQSEMAIKTEPGEEESEDETLLYSPLTCELCAEVFTVPAAWVRHVQGHGIPDAGQTRKRKFKEDDDSDEVVLLRCDLCQKHFTNPAQWVRHIQSTHTEREGAQNKKCEHCNKTFPSHASMLVHLRTHTGECPFVCGVCNKGFNVKSNLLRHLRTFQDHCCKPNEQGEPAETSPPRLKTDAS